MANGTAVHHRLRFVAVLAGVLIMTSCGPGGSTSSEGAAVQTMHSALAAYNAASPTDIASTAAACAQALSDLAGADALAAAPRARKHPALHFALHVAFLQARRGFSDCAKGGKSMDYTVMARGDQELMQANESLTAARTAP